MSAVASRPVKPSAVAVDPATQTVRVKLTSPFAGPNAKAQQGSTIRCTPEVAARHVANDNGVIVEGPEEQSEIDRLRLENAQLKQTISAGNAATPKAK